MDSQWTSSTCGASSNRTLTRKAWKYRYANFVTTCLAKTGLPVFCSGAVTWRWASRVTLNAKEQRLVQLSLTNTLKTWAKNWSSFEHLELWRDESEWRATICQCCNFSQNYQSALCLLHLSWCSLMFSFVHFSDILLRYSSCDVYGAQFRVLMCFLY